VLANNQIGFEVGTYEATRPLVIDPVVRAQVEGDGESSRAIAMDQQGQIYTTGRVGNKVFVEKRAADPDQTVLYSHVFGGSGKQVGTAIAVDRKGRAYVTGWTDSLDFPIFNALQGALAGGTDAFIMRLAADGRPEPEYSTYLGGDRRDRATGIAVHKGRAYVTGFTDSTNFPTEKPLQGSDRGQAEAVRMLLSRNSQRMGGSGIPPTSGERVPI
jgi:beta-propeller repeat-containing protein